MGASRNTLYWVRRALFYHIFYIIIFLQFNFLIFDVFGISYGKNLGIILSPGAVPLMLTIISLWIERNTNKSAECRVDWRIWGVIGPVMFGLWALGYFLSGHLTDPARARVLSNTFDRFIPFDYNWVFLYLSVYPMFILPYFFIKRGRALITLTLSYLIMLIISYTIFLVIPVAMYHRPALQSTNLASWSMNMVYGQDPLWNCMPSTHCGVAILSAVAMYRDNHKFGIWTILTALMIGVSTLYTKQHYVVDVLAGYTLGLITYWSVYRIMEPRMPQKIPVPKALHIDDVDIS